MQWQMSVLKPLYNTKIKNESHPKFDILYYNKSQNHFWTSAKLLKKKKSYYKSISKTEPIRHLFFPYHSHSPWKATGSRILSNLGSWDPFWSNPMQNNPKIWSNPIQSNYSNQLLILFNYFYPIFWSNPTAQINARSNLGPYIHILATRPSPITTESTSAFKYNLAYPVLILSPVSSPRTCLVIS